MLLFAYLNLCLALRSISRALLCQKPTFNTHHAWDRDYYCPPEAPTPPIPLPPLTLGTVLRNFHDYSDICTASRCAQPMSPLAKFGTMMPTNWRLLTKTRGCSVGSMQTSLLAGESRVAQLTTLFAARDGQTMTTKHTIRFFQVPENSQHCFTLSRVSGARRATDFVELPSILMEHFLNSPTVLSLFDLDGTSVIRHTGNHHEDHCGSIDMHSQILLVMLDQEYHSADVLNPDFDSTATLARLHDTRGLIPLSQGRLSKRNSVIYLVMGQLIILICLTELLPHECGARYSPITHSVVRRVKDTSARY